jgi:hypothetical protein
MPNRILRDGFVDSEPVNALTDWAHRVYSNLLVKSDDAGRYDGRVAVLRSHLFPLGTSRRIEDFNKALKEMESPKDEDDNPLYPLVIRYECNGNPYLQLTKWQRCGKAIQSRYPWRDGSFTITYVERETRDGPKDFVSTSLVDGMPMGSSRGSDGVTAETNTETDTKTSTKTDTKTETEEFPPCLDTPEFHHWWGEWETHRRTGKKKPVTPKARKLQFDDLEKMGVERAIAAIRHSIKNDWIGIFEEKNNGKPNRRTTDRSGEFPETATL